MREWKVQSTMLTSGCCLKSPAGLVRADLWGNMGSTFRLAGLAVGAGIALAVAGGTGVAHAEATIASSTTAASTPASVTDATTTSAPSNAGRRSGAAKGFTRPVNTVGRKPATGNPELPAFIPVAGSLSSAARELESPAPQTFSTAAVTARVRPALSLVPSPTSAAPELTGTTSVDPDAPSPSDEQETPYGDLGKWMLRNGQIANWIGQKLDGKTLLEPINVVIVDTTSTSVWQSTFKLNWAMFWSGFPAQIVHSTGYQGLIDDVTYGQQPAGPLVAYSDCLFFLSNNHGRVFGPYPAEDGGYIWTAAFSREDTSYATWPPTHTYSSFNTARDALRRNLVRIGGIDLGYTAMGNAYDSDTITTGDADGFAAVIGLR